LSSNFYIPQALHLKDIIHSIWQVQRLNSFHKEHIIPTGIVEVIFNFTDGAPIVAQLGKKQYHLPACFINGFNTLPIRLELPVQQVFFGVRLQPLAVKKIIGTPASLFSDSLVDLTLLGPAFNSLWHQLGEQNNFDSRVLIFCSWIEKNFFDWQPREKAMNHFLCAVDHHDLSVPKLANLLCYSPRHLSRKIIEATGMNTEEILLYKKYLHAIHLIHHTGLSLTRIAYESHFSDQSHFIKAFKTYAQLTPGAYYRNKGDVKGHILENVR
jgi:AraC-like DNA-binding protein